MEIALTGGTGLIGRRLCAALAERGDVVRRLGRRAAGPQSWQWDALREAPPRAALEGVDAVVHLSGEPIAKRWSGGAWERIEASRIDGTRRLVDTLLALERRPTVLVSGSATGIYGDCGDRILTEASGVGTDRVARLCVAWERETDRARAAGIRVVNLRTGLVLDPAGGVLAKMLPAFRCGLGGRLGTGRQWMSWIHAADMTRLILTALADQGLSGPLNATAPEPVTQREFARTLGAVLRRPVVLPVPGIALRLLFGEMAGMLTASQRVLPERAAAAGFSFEHPELRAALAGLLERPVV